METSLAVTNYQLTSFDQSGENIQRYGGCSERHHSHHIKRDGRGIITKLQPGHPKEREKNLTNDTSGSVNSSSPACTPVRRYVISENKISNCKCIRSSRQIKVGHDAHFQLLKFIKFFSDDSKESFL